MASGKIDSGHRHELPLCPCSRGRDVDERGSLFFSFFSLFLQLRRDDDEESTTTIIISIIISIISSIRNGVAIGKTAARARRDD